MMKDALERKLPWLTGFAVFCIYCIVPCYLHNFDGVACAIAVELGDGANLVHGNHLIYALVGFLFHRGLGALGLKISALFALKFFNMLLGSATAALFHRLLRRVRLPEPVPALAAIGLAVSYAFWLWSLEVQVYALGAFFLVGALSESLREHPSPYRLAFWHAAAMLTHGANALFVPVALYGLWRSNDNPEKLRRSVSRYLVVAAVLVIVVYALSVQLLVRPDNIQELKVWLLGSAALGPGRSTNFITGSQAQNMAHWLSSSLEAVSPWAFLGAALWAAAAWALFPKDGEDRKLAWAGGLWLPSYFLLFSQWQPGVLVYRVSDLIPLWLLAAAAAARHALGRKILAGFVLILLAANYSSGMKRFSRPDSNAELQKAYWLAGATPPDAWIAAEGAEEVYLPYFAGRHTVNLRHFYARPDALAQRLGEILETAPVYALSDRLNGQAQFPPMMGLRPAGRHAGMTLFEITSVAQ